MLKQLTKQEGVSQMKLGWTVLEFTREVPLLRTVGSVFFFFFVEHGAEQCSGCN